MSDYTEQDDPNAPNAMQVSLKRVESAIRKRADYTLLLQLDHVCLLRDPQKRNAELSDLIVKLQQKK